MNCFTHLWSWYVQAQNGSTALHNAAANGHAKAVEALVDAPSCDCDVQNSNGNTALHLAASKGTVAPAAFRFDPCPSWNPACNCTPASGPDLVLLLLLTLSVTLVQVSFWFWFSPSLLLQPCLLLKPVTCSTLAASCTGGLVRPSPAPIPACESAL